MKNKIVLSFIFGILIGILLILQTSLSQNDIQIPYTQKSPELMSPSNFIKQSDIKVYEKRVVIEIDAEWATIANTNSMDPVLDKDTHVLQIIPKNENEIHLGDIITYTSPEGIRIIHRVIEINFDKEGKYFILKGDNNLKPDPYKVRFNMIDRKTVGILY